MIASCREHRFPTLHGSTIDLRRSGVAGDSDKTDESDLLGLEIPDLSFALGGRWLRGHLLLLVRICLTGQCHDRWLQFDLAFFNA